MIRDVADGIADFIREDEVLSATGRVTVIVEDRSVVDFEIQKALGQTGVCVMVAVEGFSRVDRAPVVQGTIRFQISCFENPELNRDDESAMTAEAVAERLAKILHYRKFPFLVGQMIFKDFSRDDVDEANVTRGNYEAHTYLGFEDGWKAERSNETQRE